MPISFVKNEDPFRVNGDTIPLVDRTFITCPYYEDYGRLSFSRLRGPWGILLSHEYVPNPVWGVRKKDE